MTRAGRALQALIAPPGTAGTPCPELGAPGPAQAGLGHFQGLLVLQNGAIGDPVGLAGSGPGSEAPAGTCGAVPVPAAARAATEGGTGWLCCTP